MHSVCLKIFLATLKKRSTGAVQPGTERYTVWKSLSLNILSAQTIIKRKTHDSCISNVFNSPN